MTLKTQVPSGRACLQVVADVKHMSRLDQRASQSNFDSPHTMIISAVISTVLRRQPS
jgi:hypothetical protein